MNAPVSHDFLLRSTAAVDEATSEPDGNRRYVWESSFGPIVIDINGSSIYVNGCQVLQASRSDLSGAKEV